MKRLIYSSIASGEVNFDTVGEILTHAVKRNKENYITGMMIYDGHSFLQCIEGDDLVINKLWEKLNIDPRHHALHINGEEHDEKRLFSNWNMGYMNNSHEIQEMIRKVTGRESASFETLSYPHAKVLLLQLSFLL
ncbi:MAG: BLUF domain-containing protein [Sulfuricurvum sp.]|nr:BLUF domain-containing protein [Sulfuricurvum sp.]MDP3023620.1 BLUF domain-containing protein [Sulfuricurvum sp.]